LAARVVFFIAQAQPVDAMPQGIEADLAPQLLLAALLDLAQGDIDLRGEPPAKESVVALQAAAAIAPDLPGPTVAAFLVLFPEAFHTAPADSEALGHLTGSFPMFPCPHDALT
jgi:hypothetical protein